MIRTYGAAPKQLFRVNNGPQIRVRPYAPGLTSYDIHTTENNRVLPKATVLATYKAPNGASMRPNSKYQHRFLKTFKGDNALVYILNQGIVLPGTLLLVHERTDHWSIQPLIEMTLDDLNFEITTYFQRYCEAVSIKEWFLRYPRPTETY